MIKQAMQGVGMLRFACMLTAVVLGGQVVFYCIDWFFVGLAWSVFGLAVLNFCKRCGQELLDKEFSQLKLRRNR